MPSSHPALCDGVTSWDETPFLSDQPSPRLSSLQVATSELRRKENEMWSIRVQALVHLGVIAAVAVFFHFFYILTLPSDLKFVNRLSDWALGEPLWKDSQPPSRLALPLALTLMTYRRPEPSLTLRRNSCPNTSHLM